MVISLPGGMLATLLLATADVGCSKVRLEANAGILEDVFGHKLSQNQIDSWRLK